MWISAPFTYDCRVRAQHVDDLGHLVGRAEPVQWDLLDDLVGAGRQDRRVDLARRDRIDPYAEPAEIEGHLARQRGERRLRGGIGRARERVHVRTGNGRHVHHRALGGFELLQQPARQHDRAEEVDLEHLVPDLDCGIERAHALAALGLGRDGGVVDQRVQLVAVQAALDFLDRLQGLGLVGEIDLDVVLGSCVPRAILRERVARAGDYPPAGGREALDGRMPNAAARSGEEQRAARLIAL